MTDRELLEAAAKAAGIKYTKPHELYSGSLGLALEDHVGRQVGNWSPLQDDADALRLAVKLGIELHDPYQYGKACAWLREPMLEFWENLAGDPYAATRRAIVRAAAAMAWAA